MVGVVLLTVGRRMMRQAKRHLRSLRFTSVGHGLWVEGNFGTSRVRVGRARDDSIESENRIVRSDVSVGGFAARPWTKSAGRRVAVKLDALRDARAVEIERSALRPRAA